MSNGTRRLVGKSAEYTGNYENKVTVGAFVVFSELKIN